MKSNSTITIKQYIAAAPKESREKLKELGEILRTVAPKATEEMKYGVPAFTSGKMLFGYGALKNAVSLYPTPGPIKAFEKELSKYKTSKGSIQFPLDKPLPVALIKKIAKFRLSESQQ